MKRSQLTIQMLALFLSIGVVLSALYFPPTLVLFLMGSGVISAAIDPAQPLLGIIVGLMLSILVVWMGIHLVFRRMREREPSRD